MLKIFFKLAAIVVVGGGALKAAKPNVLVILTDDQGSLDLGCYGASDLRTPVLDKLASEGVRFEQFYASAPVCCASRAGLLTGKHPWEVGVAGNIAINGEGLASRHKTMAEYFKEAGYATAQIGKWHLGHHKDTKPNGQGFDYSFGHLVGCIDNYSHFFYWSGPNKHDLFENGDEVYHNGHFFPDLMKQKALSFTAETEKPFFMYYALNLPHYPYQAPDKWRQFYKGMKAPRSDYAAALSCIDESIGELLEGLEKQGKLENTIIVFMSDHGHSTEIRAFGGGGWAGPFRGAKFSLFEGGIRVPAIISWPGKLPSGQVRKQMAVASDWLPTLLDLSEIDYSVGEFRGQSLRAVIEQGADSVHQSYIWSYGNQVAVRKGSWKLLINPYDTSRQGGPHLKGKFLYNLDEDPAERVNKAVDQPALVAELERLLR